MDVRALVERDLLAPEIGDGPDRVSFGTRIASPSGAGGSCADIESGAPAACAKIGGASPVEPKSMAPALSASSSWGPPGTRPSDPVAERLQLLLEQPLPLQEHQGAVFLVADADRLLLGTGGDKVNRNSENCGDASERNLPLPRLARASGRRKRHGMVWTWDKTPAGRGEANRRQRRGDGGTMVLAMTSPNGPGLWRHAAIAARGGLEWQLREHEFREAVAFLEVRVSREDEAIDPEVDILPHALCDLIGVADQCSPRAAAHEADAGPQVRAYVQFVAPAAMQRAMRLWPTESKRAKAVARPDRRRCRAARSDRRQRARRLPPFRAR